MKDIKNKKPGKQKRNDIKIKNRNKNKKRNRKISQEVFIPELSYKGFFRFDLPDIDLLNVLDFNLEEDLNLPPV